MNQINPKYSKIKLLFTLIWAIEPVSNSKVPARKYNPIAENKYKKNYFFFKKNKIF